MHVDTARPITMTFWIVGVLALAWNILGFSIYFSSVSATEEQLAAQLSPEQLELLISQPIWVTSAHALAVTAGIVGCTLLLLRSGWCLPVFSLSLAAIVVQDLYIFGFTDSVEVFGGQTIIIQSLVLIIAVFLVFYARKQKSTGVLR